MNSLVQRLPDLIEELKNINITILTGRLERGNILSRKKNQKHMLAMIPTATLGTSF